MFKSTVEILTPYGRTPNPGEPRAFSVFAKRDGRYLLSIVRDEGEGRRLSNHAPVPHHLTDAEAFEAQVVLAHHLEAFQHRKADGPMALRDAATHHVLPTDADQDFEAWLDRQDPEAKTCVLMLRVIAEQEVADEITRYLLELGRRYRDKIAKHLEREKDRAKNFVLLGDAEDRYADHVYQCGVCEEDTPAPNCDQGTVLHQALCGATWVEEAYLDGQRSFDRQVCALQKEMSATREAADEAKNRASSAYLILEQHLDEHPTPKPSGAPLSEPQCPEASPATVAHAPLLGAGAQPAPGM